MDAAALAARFDAYHSEIKAAHGATADRLQELAARMGDVEQRMVRGPGGGDYAPKTWGRSLTDSDQFKAFVSNGGRGQARVEVERKAAVTTAQLGGLIPQSPVAEVATLPRRRLTIRDILSTGETAGNAVPGVREKTFTNNAAPVPEAGIKPETTLELEAVAWPVRTMAHWTQVSRQALDDAPLLQSIVDTTLRYGLAYSEELQILRGSGTGDNLLGLSTAATAYDTARTVAGDTRADVILHAITQAEGSGLPVDGVVINSGDFAGMLGMKGADGHYLSNGPFGTTAPRLWGRPVVDTPSMPAGEFLVLNSTAATIHDRQRAELLISDSHANTFVMNILTLLVESRLALAIKRADSLVGGTFPA